MNGMRVSRKAFWGSKRKRRRMKVHLRICNLLMRIRFMWFPLHGMPQQRRYENNLKQHWKHFAGAWPIRHSNAATDPMSICCSCGETQKSVCDLSSQWRERLTNYISAWQETSLFVLLEEAAAHLTALGGGRLMFAAGWLCHWTVDPHNVTAYLHLHFIA